MTRLIYNFNAEAFGKELYKYRKFELCLSLKKAGDILGLSGVHMMRIEKAQYEPSMSMFLKMCNWARLSPLEFINYDK